MPIKTIALSILLLAAPVAALTVGTPAPPFDLNDQFDRPWRLSSLRGRVVVLMAADQHSGEMMRPWGDILSPAYGGNIQLLGLLNLHTYPRFLRGLVAARIRSETDRGKPMLLDFEGSVGAAYEVSSRYPVIVIIDRRGVIRGIQKSVVTKEALARAREAIDAAIESE
ncbi:MAG TPA: hypothetical protein VGR24_09760 [bacterium]|jgi:hypothetical protein|nr:hypothetical protein [bacterium]